MMGNVAKLTTKEIMYLYTDRIRINPNQPRKFFSKKALEELSESIKVHGVLQPITVRFDGRHYELIAGERRLRASKLAGLTYIPCILINVDEEQSAVLAIIENLQRENLNFIEEAEGYQSLIKDFGYTQDEIAKKVGKNQSTVANKLRILKLDKEVKDKLIEHNLTERHGRALLKVNSEDQSGILDRVIKDNLNVSKTEKIIENFLDRKANENVPVAEKKRQQKIKMIIKDVRIFINSIRRSVDLMKLAGVEAKYVVNEATNGYRIVVDINTNIKE